MTSSKFQVGEWVTIARLGVTPGPTGPCRIVHVLSRDRGPQQYRIKCSVESFERIVDEARLIASSANDAREVFSLPR